MSRSPLREECFLLRQGYGGQDERQAARAPRNYETNPPVKERNMNMLGMRGGGFGEVVRGRSACAKASTRLRNCALLENAVEISGRVANHAALRGLCQPRKASGRYDERFKLYQPRKLSGLVGRCLDRRRSREFDLRCQGSSVVEQGTHKPLVGSSTLPPGTILFEGVAKIQLLERAAPKAFGVGREFNSPPDTVFAR